jgi:hypothetical protein
MNTIVIGEPKILYCKRRSVKEIYRDGEFQEIYEKKNISKRKSPYSCILHPNITDDLGFTPGKIVYAISKMVAL